MCSMPSMPSLSAVTKLENIAVLIDADNATPSNIGAILTVIEEIGTIGCKRVYGDWGNVHIQSWQVPLLKYVIDPIQQFAFVKGKNTTDIGLTIGAMDLLYSGDYDGFCLVSSDSDFTALAVRIRKSNIKVFGFGKHSSVEAFTQACDGFFYVEELDHTQTIATEPGIPKQPSCLQALALAPCGRCADSAGSKDDDTDDAVLAVPTTVAVASNATAGTEDNVVRWDSDRLATNKKLLKILSSVIVSHPKADKKGWVNFSYVGHDLKQQYPTFDAKDYGYKKVSDLIKNITVFATKVENNALYVRKK